MSWSRRKFLWNSIIGLGASLGRPKLGLASANKSDAKQFLPTWESLAGGYQTPDWFRDAKFGIWAHWSAQCQPEQGDWYARNMYLQVNGSMITTLKITGILPNLALWRLTICGKPSVGSRRS